MNPLLKTLFITFILLMLAGCATTQTEYKVDYKTKVIMPADDLLMDCDKVEPPNKDEYIKASMKEREEALYDFSFKQMKSIQKCNLRWKALRELKNKSISELSDAEVVSVK